MLFSCAILVAGPLRADPIADKQRFLATGQAPQAAVSTAPFAPAAFSPMAVVNNNNRHIQVALEDNGTFTIGTGSGGRLLFGHPAPWSTDTMVRIDGVNRSIHTGTSSGASVSGSTASVTLTVAGTVVVTERLSIVKSRGTRNLDTVQVAFSITNIDAVAHNVALRTQLDTMLGSNDGSPFRVAGFGAVTNDKEFDNDAVTAIPDVPLSTLVFDSLSNPTVIGLFTFDKLGYRTPDRLVFGYWPASYQAWDYTVDPTRSFLNSDSSVVLWWGYPTDAKNITLLPGGTTSFAFLYGIGDYTFVNSNPFQIGLFSPSELTGMIQGNSYVYTPSPFVVSGFFSNVSGSTVTGGQATLNLRPGFSLDVGETATKPIEVGAGSGLVLSTGTAQIDWRVIADGRYLGLQPYSVTARAAGKNVTAVRNIFLTAIPNAIYGKASDQNGTVIAGAAITVYNGRFVAGAATTQADGTYAVANLAPGTYVVKIVSVGRPDSYYQATVTDSTETGSTTNPGLFPAAAKVETFSYPNPVRQGTAKITFYLDEAVAADIDIFTASGKTIRQLHRDAAGPGWHEVDWPIDDVVNGVYLYRVSAGGRSGTGKVAVIKWKGR
ncbi:MAG: T9SS type A sorting domain-containing protein [Phycisphaerales bacterium]|nr:T9SS type A sorting domain-containing protein [Phycisphaerales bacterium]